MIYDLQKNGLIYDVIFWYVWIKKRPLAILLYRLDYRGGINFQVYRGGGNHLLGKPCNTKGLGKTRVKLQVRLSYLDI